ncbi:carbohydrate ABC transporter permease [Specibacter sp. AOP5-B1-6]|uniref:carbohydrate ABC transporter permease n=1 Tax=Specibacter sp. AOP5-B1-6 TaxID=3457653 RepID=UPI003FB8D781
MNLKVRAKPMVNPDDMRPATDGSDSDGSGPDGSNTNGRAARLPRAAGPARRRARPRVGGYLLMLLAVATMILPLVWMMLASFKGQTEIYTVPIQWLPDSFKLSNYIAALDAVPFGNFFINSLITTIVGAGLKIMLGLTTAYAVVFLDFPFKKFVFGLVVFALLVPQQIVIIPNYTLISDLGWINTYQGLIVPGLASAFGTFLFRQHFLTLEVSILEAAALDGASHWTRLWRFVVPISAPTIAAVALVSIVAEWNEYLWPLLVVDKAEMMTLPVGLTLLQNNDGVTNWGVLMAGTVLITVPVLIVFFLLQRRIVTGLTAGSVTG